jgi:16S rRNA (guanine966-N2)-methyltransferase
MRVIAGAFRSRRLKSLPGLETRPTPDRLRETLFNVLATRIADCTFMDAYAGTGAVGIEALSRGARRCVFIEKSRRALEVIHENLAALGLESRAEVFTSKAATVLDRARADIAFLDPPYEMAKEYEAAINALDGSETPLVIVQHSSRSTLADAFGSLTRYRIIKQGDNCLSFYER